MNVPEPVEKFVVGEITKMIEKFSTEYISKIDSDSLALHSFLATNEDVQSLKPETKDLMSKLFCSAFNHWKAFDMILEKCDHIVNVIDSYEPSNLKVDGTLYISSQVLKEKETVANRDLLDATSNPEIRQQMVKSMEEAKEKSKMLDESVESDPFSNMSGERSNSVMAFENHRFKSFNKVNHE